MPPLPAPWPSKCVNLPSNSSNYPPGKPAPLPPISHTSQVPAPQFTQTLGVTFGQHTLPYPPSSHRPTPTTVPHTHPHHHTQSSVSNIPCTPSLVQPFLVLGPPPYPPGPPYAPYNPWEPPVLLPLHLLTYPAHDLSSTQQPVQVQCSKLSHSAPHSLIRNLLMRIILTAPN